MRATAGPTTISVLEVREDSPVTVFRIVRADEPDDPVFLNSLRSNYELGDEPRRVERSSTVIHMGISAYVAPAAAHGTAERFPKLGDYVAELSLRHGNGFNYARTGHPGHLTIWGDPVKLLAAVVDTVHVGN